VPDRPGETLTAKVRVQSNGNQRFVVPVTLHVGHNLDFTADAPPLAPEPLLEVIPLPASDEPLPVAELPPPVLAPPLLPRRRQAAGPNWAHVIPAALLALALLIVVIVDLAGEKETAEPERVETKAPESFKEFLNSLAAKDVALQADFNDEKRFGLTIIAGKQKGKKLTFEADGATNNTIVRVLVPGAEAEDKFAPFYFGQDNKQDFYWVERLKVLRRNRQDKPVAWRSRMRYRSDLFITQYVFLVPTGGDVLDACLVVYKLENKSKAVDQTVGIRFLLDTYIGGNDGVPFTVPGRSEFVTTKEEFKGAQVPSFVEAVEKEDDPKDPGTVARLGLKGVQVPGFPKFDDISRLVICQYPGNPQAAWELPFVSIDVPTDKGKKDSCAVIYWEDKEIKNGGGTRYVGFTYGLGSVNLEAGSQLALSVPGVVSPGKVFDIIAYVYDATEGQEVKLELPDGLELVGDEKVAKKVEKTAKRVAVSWKVRATKTGTIEGIRAKSDKKTSPPAKVEVKKKSIF
jgi:hypothetical protein